MATVFSPPLMRDLTDGPARFGVDGASSRQIVAALEARFPAIRTHRTNGDTLSRRVAVSVDGYVTRLGPLERVGPTSEVHLLPAIGGGGST